MSLTLVANQEVVLSVVALDAKGSPTADNGTRAWSVDDPSVVSLTDNGDGTQTAAVVGPLGTAIVTVTDTQPDGSTLSSTLDLVVAALPVASIEIVAGTPTEIPAPPAP